jgi:hypothetical protein
VRVMMSVLTFSPLFSPLPLDAMVLECGIYIRPLQDMLLETGSLWGFGVGPAGLLVEEGGS